MKDPLFSIGNSHLHRGLNVIKIVFFLNLFCLKAKKKKNVRNGNGWAAKKYHTIFESNYFCLSTVNDGPFPHLPISLENTGVYSPFIHLVSGIEPEGSQVKHQARQSQTLQISNTGLRSLKKSFMAQLNWGPRKRGGKIQSILSSHMRQHRLKRKYKEKVNLEPCMWSEKWSIHFNFFFSFSLFLMRFFGHAGS